MKKYISPVAAGGAPLNNERFINELGAEYWTAMESILAGIQTSLPGYSANGNFGIVLSGCQLTGGGPYGMTPGVIYLNQQFMYFPGFTSGGGLLNGAYNLQADPANPALTAKVFADGVSRNLITENRATILGGAPPGTGHYVSFSTPTNPGGVNVLSGAIAQSSAVLAVTNGLTDSLISWITTGLTYSGSYVTGSPAFAYKKTGRGTTKLRGAIQNGTANCTDTFVTLPVGFRPAQNFTGGCHATAFAGRNYYRVTISTAGALTVDQVGIAAASPMTASSFSFDNIEFE